MDNIQLFVLCVFALHQSLAMPLGSQCMDESYCSLPDYYGQLINLPHRINERSIASWTYVENIDLDRIPRIIHEAYCHSSHSCQGVEGPSSLETIPISLRVPVLKRNPACFPRASYSLEYESINIACICAVSRSS
ncbi:interleukin-17D-like [Gadus macrocephalus]|uniref:interleukin-17D-like n=1 Tax=Gadus macrocephalus TaxID=80720 RepID=UPI0028CB8A77|nr:interleukin-17D-like [Gadus macrocephalus]